MKKFLIMLMLIANMCNVQGVGAVQLEGEGVENLVHSVTYHPDDREGSTYKNFAHKLEVVSSWDDILVANHKLKNAPETGISDNVFWYRSGKNKEPYVLGVEGLVLQLKNLTTDPMTIDWSESRFQLGSYFGLPFLNGMKFIDAGNPEKIPATIIQPGESVEVHLWRGDPYIDFEWANGYAKVKADASLRALVSMKVSVDGRVAYYTFKTPPIVLPKYAYSSFIVE